jgi:PAS domain-containing protein
VFALPVVGAIFLSRWQPYLTATLAAAVVGLVAVGQAPQLRWYAPALSAVAQWLEAELGGSGGGTGEPFAGFYAPSEYFVVLLDVFAVMVFACAVAAEYLASIFERLHAQLAVARAEAVRGQELWFALLEQLPLPAFLVDPDTGEIVCASASARAKFFAGEDLFAGSEFFTAVNFSYPEPVQELLLGAGGVAAQSLVRLGEQLRATEVSVQHVARDGRRFALVIVQDTTESLCVKAALDVAEHAAIVVDAQGRVRAWNKPAMGLFSAIRLDADISHLLPEMACAACWWDPGLSGRRKSFVQVMQRVYQLTSSAVPLPGEDERLYVVAFVPAAHVVTADQEGSTFTTRIRRP